MLNHLEKYLHDRKKYSPTITFLREYIPDLITENENRWKVKNFYKPRKNWRAVWEKAVF